ncbi:hypothetical protein [[Clostridium] polysaccharolyticum]|uniref:Uncharacterized protein n=1 Tax=[Clostridium] polysaccharolyticum TaxID=29364 RepID=A0A1I0AS47_9FIRM|nr:hypothetical protein [[Clostridium] polysaccharolyticum]SES97217.1 hypothetical protein SAMN04487772_10620 [[Clostridium] polysaccharolyticum]
MSDLSSNSMSREQLIRSARANCMKQIDSPQIYADGEENVEVQTGMAFKKSTYIRLFFSCLLLLGVAAVKQSGWSYSGYDFNTIVTLVEDNHHFDRIQQEASEMLEKDVIPAFQQILNSDKKK